MKSNKLQTVIELPEYIKQIKKLLGSKEQDELIFEIASNPEKGDG